MTHKSAQPKSEQPEQTQENPNNSIKTEHSTTEPEQCPTPFAYSELVKEHFLSPRNFLMGDESAWPADAIGLVGNPICGDQMKMFLRIDRDTDTITDVRWKTYGCASAIASTSALSELVKGRTLDDALSITAEEISDYLGGLPERKVHCSVLGHDALKSAIENYRKK